MIRISSAADEMDDFDAVVVAYRCRVPVLFSDDNLVQFDRDAFRRQIELNQKLAQIQFREKFLRFSV